MESRAKETAKKTAKKGKNGIVKLIFSRIFIFALLIFLQLLVLFYFFWHVNEQFKIFYDFIRIITVFLVLYIVNEKSSDPTMKMIWSIVILIIPIFGALLYLFVKFQPTSVLLRKRLEVINHRSDNYLEYKTDIKDKLQKDDPLIENLGEYIYKYSGCPPYENSKITYFASGEEKYDYLIKKLKEAKSFIFLEYFIIEEGEVWNSVLEILKQKVKEGVEVRVIYDGMCSLTKLPMGYFKKLREYGIKAKSFNPMKPFLSTHQNNRDHRKNLVIDGTVAFTGGINLADEYMNLKERFGYWKDTAVMIEGEAAKSFTLLFLQMWNVDEEIIGDYNKYLDVDCPSLPDTSGYIIGYGDEPFDDEKVGEQVYLSLINTAKKYVHIITPYLVIDNVMMEALTFAAKRGVDVKIIMPGIPDKAYAYCLARTYYEELIKNGVEIYEFTPGFTHAKQFVVDDDKATVGTINLDYRSLYLHFECGCLMYKNKEISLIEDDFKKTLQKSEKITLEECRNRSALYKLCGSILKMIAPLM